MSYFGYGFRTALGIRLRSVRSWLALLLLPALIVGAMWLLPERELSGAVQVGVALPETGGDALWELLQERSDAVLQFVLSDEAQIDRNIAAGRWDCGLVLAEDFGECLENAELDRAITMRIGPGSAVYPLVRETVSACLAQLISPEIARKYLLDSAIAGEDDIDQLQPRLEGSLDASQRVIVTLSTSDGSALEPLALAREGRDLILCWMISAVILARMLLGATDLGCWSRSAPVGRMKPVRALTWLMAPRAAADGLLMILSGFGAMLLLGKGLWGCAAVLGYVLFWLAASVMLARFRRISDALPVCMPFAAVISLLLSSVLMDISLILPELSGVSRWLPVRLFLGICEGKLWNLAPLLLGAAGCLVICAAADILQRIIKRETT